MKAADTFVTAVQNLGRRKVRTFLTSVGVFVGILTIVTMVSLGIGIQKQITDIIRAFGLENVLVEPDVDSAPRGAYNPGARLRPEVPLNDAAIAKLRAIDCVVDVRVAVALPAAPEISLTLEGRTFAVAMRDRPPDELIFTARLVPISGTELPQTPSARGIALAPGLLRSAGYTNEEIKGLAGKRAQLEMLSPRGDKFSLETVVVGVVEIPGRQGMELGNADKADIKRWWFNDPQVMETEGYDWAILKVQSVNDAVRVARAVETEGFASTTLQILLDQVNRIFSILQVMLSSVGLLALAVASIGIVNTMIMAIYERTREIGILKAVGASNGDVLRMFMLEAGLIGLLGGIVGVIGGWLLGIAGNNFILDILRREQIPISDPFFLVTPELVAGALVFATFIGVAAGIYPAFRAARLDPLVALRHE